MLRVEKKRHPEEVAERPARIVDPSRLAEHHETLRAEIAELQGEASAARVEREVEAPRAAHAREGEVDRTSRRSSRPRPGS